MRMNNSNTLVKVSKCSKTDYVDFFIGLLDVAVPEPTIFGLDYITSMKETYEGKLEKTNSDCKGRFISGKHLL